MQLHIRGPIRGTLAAAVLALAVSAAAWRPARADGVVHVVQPGDNLYRIGLQYGVSWIDIQQANQLPSTLIYPGQQLIIPVHGSAPATPPAADPTPTPAPPAPVAGSYVVQRGDSLSAIARRFGLATADLALANHLSNPSLIYAGQTLVIPGAGVSLDPAASPPSGGNKLILVDISEQHMYVYQDGALVYSWVVSTGEPGRDTAPGNYTVLDKIPNAYGSTWDLWMPDWLGIYWAGNLQNGIHALPILSGGQRLWDGYLGTRVSFGCVILGIEEAHTLYEWAEVGTPVTIQW